MILEMPCTPGGTEQRYCNGGRVFEKKLSSAGVEWQDEMRLAPSILELPILGRLNARRSQGPILPILRDTVAVER